MRGLKVAPLAALTAVIVPEIVMVGGHWPTTWQDARWPAVAAATVWYVYRSGVLGPLVVGLIVQNVLQVFPLTSHLSGWYAPVGLAGIFVIAAVGVYGFYASLGGKPLFSTAALDN